MVLIELEKVSRFFNTEDGVRVEALRDVSLVIGEGEFVCITGPSGSGKTTLMNILGCLDRPGSGSYRLAGREVSKLGLDSLALLRSRTIGFIFQDYNLLDSVTTRENVELPGLYAGMKGTSRKKFARELLCKLGLEERAQHFSSELSGGEQQRVSIARALMNGPKVILADEPTGALDRKNGEEVIRALEGLAAQGQSVVIVSHHPEIAARAHRRIELSDGRILSDSGPHTSCAKSHKSMPAGIEKELRHHVAASNALRLGLSFLRSALRQGRRLRTLLTVLGTMIGVWLGIMAVIVGQSVYSDIITEVNTMGLDRITVLPNKTQSAREKGFAGLALDDARAIQEHAPNVRAVSPTMYMSDVPVRRGEASATVRVSASVDLGSKEGRGNIGYRLEGGQFITSDEDRALERVAVLGAVARDKLFPPGVDPIGQEILVKGVSFRVKGVLKYRTGMIIRALSEEELRDTVERANNWIHIPFRAANAFLARAGYINEISVYVNDPEQLFETATAIRDLGIRRHGADAFYVEHPGGAIRRATRLRESIRLVLGTIAAVALLAGSLGIMTVMLMSVRARRREIGLRMAVGAKQSDISGQFLCESLVLSFAGGVLGALVALACITVLSSYGAPVKYSHFALMPLGCALLAGLLSGVLPARRAASIDPAQALADR